MKTMEENFSQEVQSKLAVLRAKRNEYNDKASEMQKEIDKTIMEAYQVDQYKNGYISFVIGVNTFYMYVRSIDRLIRGCRFTGETLMVQEGYFTYEIEANVSVVWESVNEIKIMTKDEFLKVYNKTCTEFINKLDNPSEDV